MTEIVHARAVLLDMDGTLVDSTAVVERLWLAWAEPHGIDPATVLGVVHAPLGKISFAAERLVANAHALMETIVKAKPSAAKGKYLKSVTMSSTMGPGVTIDTSHVDELVKH